MIDCVWLIVSSIFFTFLFTSFSWNICFVTKQDKVIKKLSDELFDLKWAVPLHEQKAREEGFEMAKDYYMIDSETNKSYVELIKLAEEFYEKKESSTRI